MSKIPLGSWMKMNILNSEVVRKKLHDSRHTSHIRIDDKEVLEQMLMNQQFLMLHLLEQISPGSHEEISEKFGKLRCDFNGDYYYSE